MLITRNQNQPSVVQLQRAINDKFMANPDYGVDAVCDVLIEELFEDEHLVPPAFWQALDCCIGQWFSLHLVTYDSRSGLIERKS